MLIDVGRFFSISISVSESFFHVPNVCILIVDVFNRFCWLSSLRPRLKPPACQCPLLIYWWLLTQNFESFMWPFAYFSIWRSVAIFEGSYFLTPSFFYSSVLQFTHLLVCISSLEFWRVSSYWVDCSWRPSLQYHPSRKSLLWLQIHQTIKICIHWK